LVETKHGAITIPPAAVQRGPEGIYAYVVTDDNKAQTVPIKVSAANTGAPVVLIESGITAGQRVVVDGQLKLRPGVSVKSQATAPSPAATP
jgi:multidrug efflux system membrane fusion protein